MFRLALILLVALSFNAQFLFAQDVFSDDKDIQALIDDREPTKTGSGFAFGHTSITSVQYLNNLIDKNPRVKDTRAQIESFISEAVSSFERELINPAQGIPIDLTFHVLYREREERITEEQIQSQLEALNRDFGKVDTKFEHIALDRDGFNRVAGEVHFNFSLSRSSTSGSITYKETKRDCWPLDDSIKSKEEDGVPAVNPLTTINVWIANLGGASRGYATMPGGPEETDGIVIDYRFVGIGGSAVAPYDEGKTLTHLIANYLNIHSLWGEGYCKDDGVSDTPIHNSPNFGCPRYRHITTCSDKIVTEMTMNFMDNTDDACTTMFTQGQRDRMYANLISGGPRHSLISKK